MNKPKEQVTLAEYFEYLSLIPKKDTREVLKIAQEQTKLLIVLDHLETCLSLPSTL